MATTREMPKPRSSAICGRRSDCAGGANFAASPPPIWATIWRWSNHSERHIATARFGIRSCSFAGSRATPIRTPGCGRSASRPMTITPTGLPSTLMTFTSELLTDRKTQFWVNMIRAYELVPDIMRMLGVRFVLSDAAIDMPGFTEVEHMEVTGEGTPIRPDPPVNLFLYELAGANLADWSPVDVTVVKDNQSIGGRVAATSGIVAGARLSLVGSAAPVERSGRDAARPSLIRPQRIPISRRGGRLVAGAPAPAIFSLLVANGQGRSRRAIAAGELPADRPVVQGNGGCQIQVRFRPMAIAMPHRRCGDDA